MNIGGVAQKQMHTNSLVTRRDMLRCAGVAAVGTSALLSNIGQNVADAHSYSLATVSLPPDIGQAAIQVFIEETAHTLRGSMLDYWRANGAASVFGNPISEPFAASDGYYSQAFENVVMQYREEFLYTHDPIMRLMPIGRIALEGALGWDVGRWFEGPASARRRDQLLEAVSSRSVADPDIASIVAEGGVFVEESGHTIFGDILAWYRMNEGAFYFGAPLTEPFRENEQTFQYFEGGLVAVEDGQVKLVPLGRKLAGQLGIDTTPVDENGLPRYDELLFWKIDNPTPLGDPRAQGRKWLEISITQQTLYAYQGNTLISSSLVSTGLSPNDTQLGFFHVRLRFPVQDMDGFTDQTGEVLGFGDAPPGTTPYEVSDVPNVLYFSMAAEAIHGAYWHNNFGQRMSHGCVNLPLQVAEWLYGWAPLGTEVWIHE